MFEKESLKRDISISLLRMLARENSISCLSLKELKNENEVAQAI
jgi:hypothetical protein